MNDFSRNISGNNLQGSQIGNLNQGDSATQSQIISKENYANEQLMNAIITNIKTLPDGVDKEDAMDNATKMDTALREKNLDRVKKIFGWLPQAVQLAADVIASAKNTGLHF